MAMTAQEILSLDPETTIYHVRKGYVQPLTMKLENNLACFRTSKGLKASWPSGEYCVKTKKQAKELALSQIRMEETSLKRRREIAESL